MGERLYNAVLKSIALDRISINFEELKSGYSHTLLRYRVTLRFYVDPSL